MSDNVEYIERAWAQGQQRQEREMSDSYLPDNEPRYILSSLEELAAKKLPHAPTFRKAADEITRLRADLAAVTEERDRMRALLVCLYDAAGPLDADKMPADDFAQIITIVLDARAAIEGVTKKEGTGNE